MISSSVRLSGRVNTRWIGPRILGGDDLPRLDSSTAAKVVLLSFDRMRKLPSYPAAYLSVPDVILFFSSSP